MSMHLLIANEESFIQSVKNMYGLDVSPAFVRCANQQLSALFVQLTQLKPGKNIGLMYDPLAGVDFQHGELYAKDIVSGIVLSIFVGTAVNRVFVVWDSASGKIYDINDNNIPYDDIRFAFHSLQPLTYRRQLHKKDSLPFYLGNLPFTLEIDEIGVDANISMQFAPGLSRSKEEIAMQIDDFLAKFRVKDATNHLDLTLHNWKLHTEKNLLLLKIDTGLTGYAFYKAFLQFLANLNAFIEVKVK